MKSTSIESIIQCSFFFNLKLSYLSPPEVLGILRAKGVVAFCRRQPGEVQDSLSFGFHGTEYVTK